MLRGVVHIAPVALVPVGSMIDPQTGLFVASWQGDGVEEDGVLEEIELVGAEAAVLWGRARAETVTIGLGHRHDTFFSAGDSPVEDDDGPIPAWPPAGPPDGGWWQPPPRPTLAEVEQVTAEVDAGTLSVVEAAQWALARLDPAIEEEAAEGVIEALARLAAKSKTRFFFS
jgi:hypothetical protein